MTSHPVVMRTTEGWARRGRWRGCTEPVRTGWGAGQVAPSAGSTETPQGPPFGSPPAGWKATHSSWSARRHAPRSERYTLGRSPWQRWEMGRRTHCQVKAEGGGGQYQCTAVFLSVDQLSISCQPCGCWNSLNPEHVAQDVSSGATVRTNSLVFTETRLKSVSTVFFPKLLLQLV